MKKKLLIIGLVFLILIPVAAFAIPYFFKDKLVELIRKEANKKLTAHLDFDNDVSLSLFKDFPKLSVGINKLSISKIKDFDNDTLFYANNVRLAVDVMSVIDGKQIVVREIHLIEPKVNLLVNELGNVNWNITKPDTLKEESKPFNYKLAKLVITKANLLYDDKVMNTNASLQNYNYDMSGDFTQDVIGIKNILDAEKFTVNYGGIKYLNEVNFKANADINADLKNKKYTFSNNEFLINGLKLIFSGDVALPNENDIAVNIKANAPKADFKSFLSLIPALYAQKFETVQTDGKVAINLEANGIYNKTTVPKFRFLANATNAWFKYPSLPGKVDNINFNLNVNNADGVLNNTQVILNNFTAKMGNNTAAGNLTINQALAKNPFIDTNFKLNTNLGELKNYVPTNGTALSGLLQADVTAKGSMASIESKAYDKIDAKGKIIAQNMQVKSSAYALPVYIKDVNLNITPNYSDMPICNLTVGNSDFSAKGKLYNLFSYVFSKNTLKGELETISNQINANQLMAGQPKNTSNTASKQAATTKSIDIPGNIDFSMKSKSNLVLYDSLQLKSVVGSIHLKDKKVYMDNFNFNLWEGNVAIKGVFDPTVKDNAKVDYTLDLKSMNIANTLKNFKWLQNYIPVVNGLIGSFSTKIAMNSILKNDFTPNLNTLNLNGLLNVAHVELSKFTSLTSIQQQLGQKSASDGVLKDLLLSLDVENGNLIVKPFSFKTGDLDITLGGKTSVASDIAYNGKIKLPASLLKNNRETLNNLLAQSPFKNTTIDNNASLDVNLLMGGKVTKPTVKLDLGNITQNLTKQVKEIAKAEIDRQKTQAIQRVQEEKQKAITHVEGQIKEQKEKLNTEINKKTQALSDTVQKQLGKKIGDLFNF